MTQLRVGILGAAGYTGAELIRLIDLHPHLKLSLVAARENAGQRLGDILPQTEGAPEYADMVLEAFDESTAKEASSRIDVAFTALPHAASARLGGALLDAGVQVVDLSADFRLSDASVYGKWYGEHPRPELLEKAVYGLPELNREKLRGAKLIACPGCYPTSAIVPLAPLFKAGLLENGPVIVDGKSGVSGAGRKPGAKYHFPEAAEGMRPYSVGGVHRHTPEMEQELSKAAGSSVSVLFTPQLAPMTRGILTTAYARPKAGVTVDQCRAAAKELYGTGLVTVLPEGRLPDTLHVRGSGRAMVAYAIDARTGYLLAMSAIDNLARGASVQAMQAFNVSRGFEETLGVPRFAMFP